MPKEPKEIIRETRQKYSHLTDENIYRLLILYCGVNFQGENSFPDQHTKIEATLTLSKVTARPLITFLRPNSPFEIIEGGKNNWILLFEKKYVDKLEDFQLDICDVRKPEPFYSLVDDEGFITLKLNPIQLCDFYKKGQDKNSPCFFCFRNDFPEKFRNIKARSLIGLIEKNEKRDGFKKLQFLDEMAIVTGTYPDDKTYLKEITTLINGLKKYLPAGCKITVGSHEVKSKAAFEKLKKSGVTDFAFSLETLSDKIGARYLKNRKGRVGIAKFMNIVKQAVDVFGAEQVILRLVAGIGDPLDKNFEEKIKYLSELGNKKTRWNIDVFLPFTHNLWQIFEEKPFYTLDYLFGYCNILNKYISQERFIRFRISP